MIYNYHHPMSSVPTLASALTSLDRDTLYFGVELEVEVKPGVLKEQLAETLRPLTEQETPTSGWAYICRDGSLDNGFEIVSVPMTMEQHAEKWAKVEPLLKEHCLDFGMTPGGDVGVGMHVHVSKGPLSQQQIATMYRMLDSSKNAEVSEKMANRSRNSYNPFGRDDARITAALDRVGHAVPGDPRLQLREFV